MDPRKLKLKLLPYGGYRKPAGDDGSDDGGTGVVDRGDAWVPTDDPAGGDDDAADSSVKPETKAEKKPEEKPEEKPETKTKIIPLDRHEKILAKERSQREDLERQLASFQGNARVADTNADLSKMEDAVLKLEADYTRAISDGETKVAADLMAQIRRAERQINDTKVQFRVEAATSIATEQARYDIALERVEDAYPQLNPDSEKYDEELMRDVADMKAMYQGRGDTPTKALQRAVAKLVKPATSTQEAATTVAPRVTEADVAGERKKAAVATTADAVKRTPPNTANVGQDSDKMGGGLNAKDVMKMPQEEFAKLSEAALSKMRGDTL